MDRIINPGKYNKKIQIVSSVPTSDADGFKSYSDAILWSGWAEVKTTSGYTMLAANTDFEEAHTRFTIRFPRGVSISNDNYVLYNSERYKIDYANNIDEAGIELEIQAVLIKK